jgi:hypothetical protein
VDGETGEDADVDGPTTGLVARYPDGERAGRAIARLSRRGVDGGRIHLVGGHPDGDRHDQRRVDAGTTGQLAGNLGRGVAVGAVVGAVFGAVVLLLVTSVAASAAVAVGALAGGSAGAGLGALTGLQATPSMSTAWAETFAPDPEGGVVVAVEARGDDALDRIEDALAGTGATDIRRAHDLEAAGRDLRV